MDTNVLLRLLTNDDPVHAERAIALAEEDFRIGATVLLETEWVLRSFYGWSREQRVTGLRILIDMPRAADVPAYAAWALDRMAEGADLGDMMHLGSAEGASSFATFDKKLRRRAGADSPVPVETLS